MKFDNVSLKTTAHAFHAYTEEKSLSLKSKCRTFDLWAQILAGKNYSSLMAQLAESPVELELSVESAICMFKARNRVIDEGLATEVFANTIQTCLYDLCPVSSAVVDVLKNQSDMSLMCVDTNRVAFIKENNPGYGPIRDLEFSGYIAASDHRNILLKLASQSFERQLTIFGSNLQKRALINEQRFESRVREDRVGFSEFLSEYLYKELKLDMEYAIVEAYVYDGTIAYFNMVPEESRPFDFELIKIADFIESIAGSAASTLDDYLSFMEEPLEAKDFENLIMRKLDIYFPDM
ncbi:hypothetical protein [Pseudoalteromonas sp. PPB1]|uniref:hypothetical protein n=1 Tax=Pseudoalteromonas sp. PPB1 TaxID=2756136 RepID=UPI001891667E|nr:hypothetical protein [Pseudoalteromonas sp. PPB1]